MSKDDIKTGCGHGKRQANCPNCQAEIEAMREEGLTRQRSLDKDKAVPDINLLMYCVACSLPPPRGQISGLEDDAALDEAISLALELGYIKADGEGFDITEMGLVYVKGWSDGRHHPPAWHPMDMPSLGGTPVLVALKEEYKGSRVHPANFSVFGKRKIAEDAPEAVAWMEQPRLPDWADD